MGLICFYFILAKDPLHYLCPTNKNNSPQPIKMWHVYTSGRFGSVFVSFSAPHNRKPILRFSYFPMNRTVNLRKLISSVRLGSARLIGSFPVSLTPLDQAFD